MLNFGVFTSAALLMLASSTAASTVQFDGRAISSNCQKACKQLTKKFGSDLVHDYAQDNLVMWDSKQLVEYACRFTPNSTTNVSVALKILTQSQCTFAVKCGGHSRDPDFSNSVGGVTLDLRHLNQVEVAEDRWSARVGGGAINGEVFRALAPYGLGFVGGRVGTVGVGGFATGGGTSILASRYGWSLDNILEYELVLPNATTVTVSQNQHPDLYFALRGAGGANFGIVTAFTVRTFPQGSYYQGTYIWNDTYVPQALGEIIELWTGPEAGNVSLDSYYGYTRATDSFSLTAAARYLEPVLNPSAFEGLRSVPALRAVGGLTNLSAASGAAEITSSARHLFQTLTYAASREVLNQALTIFREEVRAAGPIPGFQPLYITYPIPTAAIAAMSSRGGNALGLSGAKGPLFVTLLSTSWSNATDDAAVGTFYDKVMTRVEAETRIIGVYNDYKYIGYGRAGQDIFSSYGKVNHARLKAIQKSVDCNGVFTTKGLCRGGFKLN